MRPITSPLLQQNNNNNYPCLSAAGPGPLPLKCPRPALPISRRPELGLTGLPLIRGLRAWALCSRNCHRPGGHIGQAPVSCLRPADVQLSPDWGLTLGLDARAGIGALVATLQSSEGSSRTQTQSLFLRTAQASTPQSGGALRGWLRSRTGVAQVQPAQTAASRVRERSGRRWRKSASHTAGREKAHTKQNSQDQISVEELRSAGQVHRVVLGDERGEEIREEHRLNHIVEIRDEYRQEDTKEVRDEHRQGHRDELRDEHREEHTAEYTEELREKDIDKHRLKCAGKKELEEQNIDYNTHRPINHVSIQISLPNHHRQEHSNEPTDELRQEAIEHFRVEPRENIRDKHREVLKDEHRVEVRYNQRKIRNEHRQEYRAKQGEEFREEYREELRDQHREELRDKHREKIKHKNREEIREKHREEIRVEHREKLGDKHQEKIRDEHGEVIQDEHKENHREEQREKKQDKHREDLIDEHREECRDRHGEEIRDKHIEKLRQKFEEELETDSVGHNRILLLCQPEERSVVGGSKKTYKLQSQPYNSTPTSRKQFQNVCRVESKTSLTSDTDNLVCYLWDSEWSPACTVISAPFRGSTCKFNTEGADLSAVRWNYSWATEKETCTVEHCWGPVQDKRSSPGEDQQELGSQRNCSLDSDREPPSEELEFGGFVQAPSAWSPEKMKKMLEQAKDQSIGFECTSHSWGYNCAESSWAAFSEDGTEPTEDYGGQWWALSCVEDDGSSPGASLTMGSVFTAAFLSPLDQTPNEITDSIIPTLTQLLRESVVCEEACQDQRLLDPFHDLNRMIERGNRRDSGVSRERLQRSLGLTPPALVPGIRRAHGCLSLDHAYYPGHS